MKAFLKKKGFTLIEVLIVVVILGVLAALILPRMLATPERAVTAEALNYLGVIRRAQDATAQPGSNYQTVNSGPPNGPVPATAAGAAWTGLNLAALPATSSFQYRCTGGAQVAGGVACNPATNPPAAGVCVAVRAAGPKAGGIIGMSIDSGYICGCGGAYVLNGGPNTPAATCL